MSIYVVNVGASILKGKGSSLDTVADPWGGRWG